MMENLEYIEDFFKSNPTEDQKKEFDQKIISDPSFAEDVAFYLSATQSALDLVNAEKKENFRKLYNQSVPAKVVDIKTPVRKLWRYVAAAAVIASVFIIRLLIFSPVSVEELAAKYEKENLTNLGVSMSARGDSMQLGKNLYNKGNAAQALNVFESILSRNPTDFDAREYAGIAALHLKQYDKALNYFASIASEKGYFSNPGKFYQALTLMKRNRPKDKEEAIKLLKEVVIENLSMSDIAKKWLDQMK
ncbi:MAG: hypothetical protein C5B52_16010 [Bacteroidetes bacterium]|nr:MAG: hypothetical protein C5B52_16010 [Bacteroidota bacterium]